MIQLKPKLKPCPFCGYEFILCTMGNRLRSQVYLCEDCGCRLETSETNMDNPIWNDRAGVK